MNPDWQTFLSHQGAIFDDPFLTQFVATYEGAKQVHLFDLSWRHLVRVSGDDAQDFLHGQFSNDLQKLDGKNSQLSSYSTPKGRVLALFRIMRLGDNYFLDLPAENGETFFKRLQMFVMRSKVIIEYLADTRIGIGVSGDSAAKLLELAGLEVPPEINDCRVNPSDETIICRVPGNLPRFVIFAQPEAAQELWQNLSQTAVPVSTNFWKLQQIEAGLPEIYSQTRESFVAQMLNLQVIDGVNFKKGCYPGQEVIARLQYLGKLKRRMYRLETSAGPCAPGTPVFADGATEPVGEVVESAVTPTGTLQALAVLKSQLVVDSTNLRLGESEGPGLRILDLPYSLGRDTQAG